VAPLAVVENLDVFLNRAWFKKELFWVTQASGLFSHEQWNSSVSAVIHGGEMPPVAQARSG